MHPNEQLARREIELINAGDFDALRELYADDCVLHYPGRNPLAGDHANLDEFIVKVERVFGDGVVKRELHDALGTDDHAVQILDVSADVGGRSHAWRGVVVYHVRNGKFSEAWVHVEDQHALDEFLNSIAR